MTGDRPDRRPHVIILNGVGSVGKTSTARALQKMSRIPFLHMAMDAFLDMLPDRLIGHPDGLSFATTESDGKPAIIIRAGPVLERAMRGMRRAVRAMAAEGNDVIVDDVMLHEGADREYRALLSQFRVSIVGLFAPLEILETRERTRGDREIGLARWQYERVHRGRVYDLEIDTTKTSPAENALIIRDALGL